MSKKNDCITSNSYRKSRETSTVVKTLMEKKKDKQRNKNYSGNFDVL